MSDVLWVPHQWCCSFCLSTEGPLCTASCTPGCRVAQVCRYFKLYPMQLILVTNFSVDLAVLCKLAVGFFEM